MLTDDELADELGAAFRADTADLVYAGRTRPPRVRAGALAGAAAMAAVAVVAVVAVGVNVADDSGSSLHPVAAAPAVVSSSASSPRLVTETMTLAGYTVTYQRDASAPDPLHALLDLDGLPADARKVPVTGTDAEVWVGKDPKSGDDALYVKAPTRNHDKLFALASSTWTEKQLIDLFKYGQPRAVPAVSADAGN